MKKILILGIIIGSLLLTGLVFPWTITCSTSWKGTQWLDVSSTSQTTATSQTLYMLVTAPTCTSQPHANRTSYAYDSQNRQQDGYTCNTSLTVTCCSKTTSTSAAGESYYVTSTNTAGYQACGPTTGKLSTTDNLSNCSGS